MGGSRRESSVRPGVPPRSVRAGRSLEADTMAATMTTPLEPGERPPAERGDGPGERLPAEAGARHRVVLERPPGDRYEPARSNRAASDEVFGGIRGPVTIAVACVLVFVVLGGVLGITAGLVVVAGLLGWLTGLLVRPPVRAAAVAAGVVVAGLLGIWLFGRWEGGVLNPIEYLAEVHGLAAPLDILVAAGLAAAASR